MRYIGLDSTVSLRAYPYPSGHFPDDEPHWSIVSQPSGASASITGDEDPVTATLDNLTKAGNYVIKAKCGSVDTGDNITVTAVKVDLDIYNEHGGSVLDDDDETSPGSFVLINKDDDDGANGQDNSNDVIDGPSDKQDMAKIKLDVEPSVATALTVQLNADYPLRVKVFDDGDTKVASWPHTIPISQFSSGAIYYHVEGISAGAVNFTLTVKLGTSTINSDQVKVTVKDYVNWKAWPGAQTSTSLNPTETFSSSDLGLSGQVDWILTHGGTSGATIEDSVPSGGSGTSASDKSQITVRYGTQSSSASFTNAVEVKAYDTGADSKLGACRRTIFKSSWQSPNFSNTLDSDNDLRFPDKLGSNTNKAEFNWDNERNATRIAAKMETVLNFLPSDIDWSARGVSFVFTSGSSGYTFQGREMRDFRRAFGEQLTYDPSRSHLYSDWDIDGTAQTGDTQYPSATVTNKSFTIDAPGFDADVREQGYYRNDLRDYYQWHNGSSWTRITAYCQWYVNITGALPDCSETSPSDDGTGTTSEDVPNAKPVADAGDDDSIDSGTTGYLMGGYTDADNDICTYKWQQISGPSVTISDDTAQNPTFTAPTVGSPTVLTFQLKVKDGTQDLGCYSSGNSESAADTVDITVNP